MLDSGTDLWERAPLSRLILPMPEDAILVSLIRHSLLAETAAERDAARILLDLLRYRASIVDVNDALAAMGPDRAHAAGLEANRLIARYDLR